MTSINGATLSDSDVAFPCGIRAYDHFTGNKKILIFLINPPWLF